MLLFIDKSHNLSFDSLLQLTILLLSAEKSNEITSFFSVNMFYMLLPVYISHIFIFLSLLQLAIFRLSDEIDIEFTNPL